MKPSNRIFILVFLMILLCACGGDNRYENNETEESTTTIEYPNRADYSDYEHEEPAAIIHYTLSDLLERALIRRQNIIKPDVDAVLPYTQGRTPAPLPERLWDERMRASVSVEQAIEDVNIFFAALYSAYGGYVYFGGDDVFLPIRNNAIAQIQELGDTVRPSEIEQILINGLSPVVVDRHFNIGEHIFSGTALHHHMSHLQYDRSQNGFRNRENGLYLQSIQGHEDEDLENIMRLHVDTRGNLTYSPVIVSDNRLADMSTIFTYENGEYFQRHWSSITNRWRATEYPTLEWIDGIPVVTVMAMGFDGHENAHNFKHYELFMEAAKKLQDEPVIIVDLRSNGGGNTLMAVRWLYELVGEIVPTNYLQLLTAHFDLDFHRNNQGGRFTVSLDSLEFFSQYTITDDGHMISFAHTDRIVESDQLFVLLTDRWTGSATENFVDLAFNMTNTLVIGSPTAGVLAFDRTYAMLHLPNSGVNFGFGRGMSFWPKGHFAENLGIEPDIWARGDALEAALALLRLKEFGD